MNFYTFLLVVAAALISVAVAHGGLCLVPPCVAVPWKSLTEAKKLNSPEKYQEKLQVVGSNGFSFKDCGGPSAALKGNISISPSNPITLPGKLTVSFDASVDVDVKSPLKAVFQIKKKEFIWIDVPCIDGFGSCTYDDFCSMLPPLPPAGCPPPLKEKGIPCRCPVQAGKYSLAPSVFVIPVVKHIPEFLADGEYQINIKLYYGAKELGCADVAFTLKLNE